jgi:hypothetical protein
VAPTGPELQTLTTNLPITAGEYIGLLTAAGGDFPFVKGSSTPAFDITSGEAEPEPAPEKEVITVNKTEVVTKTVPKAGTQLPIETPVSFKLG